LSSHVRLARLAAIVAALGWAGCGIDLSNGGLVCSSAGSCPPGYHCAGDNTCWKNGQDPSGGGDDLSVGDLGGDQTDMGAGGGDLGGGGMPDLSAPPDLAPTLTNGQVCSDATRCISGFCADGVCCDAACTGSCTSCNQAASLGKCSPLALGANPAHGTCGPDTTASCGRNGVCDGAGACQLYGGSTVCLAGSCSTTTNKATGDSKCDGAGHCVTPTAIACDPYVCNGAVCWTSCTTTAQCKGAMPCNSMQCGPKSNGSPCTNIAGECQSGNCVDGVCCDTPAASCGGCKQCNLVSALGTCSNVPTGQDPHGTCPTNNATCTAGGCNNAGACTPAASTVTCATACGSTNQLSTTKCNGVSTGCTNSPTTASCPSNLVCQNATSCWANCSNGGDADCVSTTYCAGGNCTPKQADGTSCTAADQCTSGVCGSYHRDADGDGQGVPAVTMFCGSTPPAGYVTNTTDCCDADANVKQGQTGWFTVPANVACGSNFYDYDCVGGAVPEFTGSAACTTSGACTVSNPDTCDLTTVGWSGPQPSCGNAGAWATSCKSQSCTTMCADPGACGGSCTGLFNTMSKTQACH
jgi:hypothetical protein